MCSYWKFNSTILSLNFWWPSLKKHDKVQKIWKKCFEKEKSIVPNSRPKFTWPSLILNIRSKSSLEIHFCSESLRKGVKAKGTLFRDQLKWQWVTKHSWQRGVTVGEKIDEYRAVLHFAGKFPILMKNYRSQFIRTSCYNHSMYFQTIYFILFAKIIQIKSFSLSPLWYKRE